MKLLNKMFNLLKTDGSTYVHVDNWRTMKRMIKPSYYFGKGAQDCLNFHVNNLKWLGITKGDDLN